MDLKIKRPKKRESEIMRENVVQLYKGKEKESTNRHRRYMKVLFGKVHTREDTIMDKSWKQANSQLRNEKSLLKSKLWVATGKEHVTRFERLTPYIQCHIKCQERLGEQIHKLRGSIANLIREIGRVTKTTYDLTRQTVHETRHQLYVAKARKHLQMMENRLEIGMSRECGFAAQNETLRNNLIRMLRDRADFNNCYMKMVQKLNYEKRYLTDLIEYAMSKFENCIETYEKMDALEKRVQRVRDGNKMEMESQVQNMESEIIEAEFTETVKARRSTTLVRSNVYRKRAVRIQKYEEKINLYDTVLNKILNYTKSRNVKAVISKYQEQESRYYSYYNYANEMGYHMTLLNNSVNRLYSDIDGLKDKSRHKKHIHLQIIADLEKQLEQKKANNVELQRKKSNDDVRLHHLLTSLQLIKDSCHVQAPTPKSVLGKFDKVDLVNMSHYLKLIQKRVYEIVAATYVMERDDDDKTHSSYIVKSHRRSCDWPTELDEIVLAQQCPECAEGDAFSVENDQYVRVLSKEEARRSLYDKIEQPEMQYRLHSIVDCRLPRSRLIAAKKLNVRGA